MAKATVTFEFEFEDENLDEDEIRRLVDGAFENYIIHPETKRYVYPSIDVEL